MPSLWHRLWFQEGTTELDEEGITTDSDIPVNEEEEEEMEEQEHVFSISYQTDRYFAGELTRENLQYWLMTQHHFTLGQVAAHIRFETKRRAEAPEDPEPTIQEQFAQTVYSVLSRNFQQAARDQGLDPAVGQWAVDSFWPDVLGMLNTNYFSYSGPTQEQASALGEPFMMPDPAASSNALRDQRFITTAVRQATDLILDNGGWEGLNPPGYQVPSMGGIGGGATPRTPAQLLDANELAEQANSMFQVYLMQDAPNAAKIAKEYIAILEEDPDQHVDFNTFVLGIVREQPAYEFIYRNKPGGVNEREYLSGYAGQIQNALGRTSDSTQLVKSHASAGSSPTGVSENLKWHDGTHKSGNFMASQANAYRQIGEFIAS